MRCLVVCGSANRSGHSAAVADAVSDYLCSSGWDSDLVIVSEIDIGHCTGCGACRKDRKCILDDDMERCSSLFEDAELVVFVSPIQFSGPSSLMKLFMDRLNRFWLSVPDHERRVCCIFCAGSPEPKFSNAVSEFKAVTLGTGSEWTGHIEISGTDGMKPSESASLALEKFSGLI